MTLGIFFDTSSTIEEVFWFHFPIYELLELIPEILNWIEIWRLSWGLPPID